MDVRPWQFITAMAAGWLCREQQSVIEHLTVEVLTLHGLAPYHVFFVIDLASRRVEAGGIAHNPGGAWMLQVVRNLLDSEDGFLVGKTHLIMDRDPVFTADVRGLLRIAGVAPIRMPARNPNLNAYAARFVLSIKSERLERLVILGEALLRLAARVYVAHYNAERPHQGLDGRFVGPPMNENRQGPIECRERLAALLSTQGHMSRAIVFPDRTPAAGQYPGAVIRSAFGIRSAEERPRMKCSA